MDKSFLDFIEQASERALRQQRANEKVQKAREKNVERIKKQRAASQEVIDNEKEKTQEIRRKRIEQQRADREAAREKRIKDLEDRQ